MKQILLFIFIAYLFTIPTLGEIVTWSEVSATDNYIGNSQTHTAGGSLDMGGNSVDNTSIISGSGRNFNFGTGVASGSWDFSDTVLIKGYINETLSDLKYLGNNLDHIQGRITWEPAKTINTSTDLNKYGNYIEAINLGPGTVPSSLNFDGTTFTGKSDVLDGSTFADFFSATTGNATYDTILSSSDFHNSNNHTISLGDGNLVENKKYLIQIWYVDNNNVWDQYFGDGDSDTSNDIQLFSSGQYAIGTFTADDTGYQTLQIRSGTSGHSFVHLNAYLIREAENVWDSLGYNLDMQEGSIYDINEIGSFAGNSRYIGFEEGFIFGPGWSFTQQPSIPGYLTSTGAAAAYLPLAGGTMASDAVINMNEGIVSNVLRVGYFGSAPWWIDFEEKKIYGDNWSFNEQPDIPGYINTNNLSIIAGDGLTVVDNKLEVSAINPEAPTLSTDLTVTQVTIGQYSNGVLIEAGTALEDIITKMLVERIPATYTNPVFNLSVSPTAGSYEIGYIPPNNELILTPDWTTNDAGPVTSYSVTDPNNGLLASGGAGLIPQIVTANNVGSFFTTTGTKNYTYSITHADGPNDRLDNLGDPSPEGAILANTIVRTAQYNVYRRVWFGFSTADSSVITSEANLKSLGGSSFITQNDQLITIVAPVGTRRVVIGYPTNEGPLTYAKVDKPFADFDLAPVFNANVQTIPGVTGLNNIGGVEYSVYHYIPANPIPDVYTFTIKVP